MTAAMTGPNGNNQGVTLSGGSSSSDVTTYTVNYSIDPNASAGTYYLTVTNPFGTSNQAAFTVGDSTPSVNGISPSTWDAGTTQVTFSGGDFGTNAPTLTLSDSSITYSLVSYSDTQIVANVTVSSGTPTEDVEVNVTSNGYGGSGFASGGGGASATSTPAHAHVNAPPNSPEVTVVAWINGQAPDIVQTISAGPTTSALQSNLGSAVLCNGQLTAWFLAFQLNLNTATDRAYATAWMFQNAANSAPPTALTVPASTPQLTGGFKLFNDFGGTGSSNTAQVGKSPWPCPSPIPTWATSISGEADQYNGYSRTSPSGMTYQIVEGRLAPPGQPIFQTIDGHSTPWIWAVIEFDSSGNPYVLNQSFPTYYVYVNGTKNDGLSFTQGPLASFAAQNATNSEETPSQVP